MSGHSKWATTKRQKAVIDNKRGAIFTKLARAISVAAKESGGDPATNFKLRLAIDQARAVNMPKDNIERAIKRGTGEMSGEVLDSVTYEAFGPAGVAIIIEGVTNNRNRTVNDLKTILSKNNSSLSVPGSVIWMFDRRGVIRVLVEGDREEAELKLIDYGAEDIISDSNGITLLTASEELNILQQKLKTDGWEIVSADLEYWPKNGVRFPEGKEGEQLSVLIEAIEENDDISSVSTNAIL